MGIIVGGRYVTLPSSWDAGSSAAAAGSAQGGGQRFVTEPPLNPLHWWDFTDITQTFQDTTGETAADTNGDGIPYIANKGSSTEAFIGSEGVEPHLQTVAGGAPSFGAGVAEHGAYFSSSEYVQPTGADILDDVPTGVEHLTIAHISATEIDISQTSGYLSWNGTECVMFSNPVSGTGVGFDAELSANPAAPPQDVWWGFISTADDEATPTTTSHSSHDAASPETATDALTAGPAAEAAVAIGRYSSATNNHVGWIGEILVWDRVLTGDEIDQFKAYATYKYGITWA
jgi:hypothetical protein